MCVFNSPKLNEVPHIRFKCNINPKIHFNRLVQDKKIVDC